MIPRALGRIHPRDARGGGAVRLGCCSANREWHTRDTSISRLAPQVTTPTRIRRDVVSYVDLLAPASRAARRGNAVRGELHRRRLRCPEQGVGHLRRMRPKQPHYLDRKLGGRMAPGRNLMVPAPVMRDVGALLTLIVRDVVGDVPVYVVLRESGMRC